jgi:tetratricopeptide (TPR) repeat protein
MGRRPSPRNEKILAPRSGPNVGINFESSEEIQGRIAVADKARLRRKDIKRPDEFITLSGRALSWVRQHQQLAIWGGAGLLACLVAVGIASAYRGARERDANADLSRALAKIAANDYAGAASELIEVSGRWEGTGVSAVAGLLGANAALRGGDADKAITELTRLQAHSAELPAYLQQQLLLSWGAALESKQQWLDAATKYKEATVFVGPYAADAMLGEARTRELGGQADIALELYRQVYEQFPDLPDRDMVAAKLPAAPA